MLAASATAGGGTQLTGARQTASLAKLNIPEKHPYLTLTPAEIATARQRAGQSEWGKRVFDKAVNDARQHIRQPWGKLPAKGDTEHRAIANRLFSAALAYALSGEQPFAEWTRDGLLAYAAIYPGLPVTNFRSKVFTQSPLFEATWLVQIVQAYDLVADSGAFTNPQKADVEKNLLREAVACFRVNDYEKDPRIKDLHYRCYNFQAWHLSAMGLVGLAVKDPELVDYVVNSRYGFRHLVAHDIRDDGMFWERSLSYHQFVISALLPFTEAMARSGVDLYGLTVPNDRSKDEDAHYITDTSASPKSMRLLWESQLYMAFPDLSYAALGDSNRGPLQASWQQLVGYHRYRDPKLEWLLRRGPEDRRDWHWLVYDLPPDAPAGALPLKDGTFANRGEYRNGCSLFPSTGVAILREAAGDFTKRPETTAASLSYGPYGGGHGHPDKLNLVVYGNGRQWLPDFGSMPYETNWKAEWTAQTVSHNTLVVDGISQEPAGARTRQWPSDDATHKIIGTLDRFDPATRLAAASCDTVYPGLKLSRAIRLNRHTVVDDFRVSPSSGKTPHQFDYVLHVDGELTESSVPLEAREGKLGESFGYQHIGRVRNGVAPGLATLTFKSGDDRFRIWVIPTGDAPAEISLGEGLTNSPEGRMPVLVVRRKAPGARFITLLEPVRPARPVKSVRLENGPNGPRALFIDYPEGAERVALDTPLGR
ncbi:MAG TPA: heparinase II/III family protein [Bryobacteraceae bacterium]|nr:heparinase II/III family protein [Bryobacteraceae bacterium]